MSAAGKNYKSLIDDDGECSNSSSVMKWTISSKANENTVSTIRELIDVREGMYWVFIAGAECIHARFMYWLVYSFIVFFNCIICILLIIICTILILLAVLPCVSKETIIIIK